MIVNILDCAEPHITNCAVNKAHNQVLPLKPATLRPVQTSSLKSSHDRATKTHWTLHPKSSATNPIAPYPKPQEKQGGIISKDQSVKQNPILYQQTGGRKTWDPSGKGRGTGCQSFKTLSPKPPTIGALRIRIGFWGILYYTYIKELPKTIV